MQISLRIRKNQSSLSKFDFTSSFLNVRNFIIDLLEQRNKWLLNINFKIVVTIYSSFALLCWTRLFFKEYFQLSNWPIPKVVNQSYCCLYTVQIIIVDDAWTFKWCKKNLFHLLNVCLNLMNNFMYNYYISAMIEPSKLVSKKI